jgi:hypothetical protein
VIKPLFMSDHWFSVTARTILVFEAGTLEN